MGSCQGSPAALVTAFVTVVATGLAACSNSPPARTAPPAATAPAATSTPSDNAYALSYTGGRAGPASQSASPVLVGYVNEEGGTPAFPEATAGVEAAIQYVNNELGGIEGHPVTLEKCLVQTAVDGQRCGHLLADDDRVKVVVVGALATGNGALYQLLASRKPVVVSNPLANEDFVTPGAAAFTPGLPGVVRGLAVFAATHLPRASSIAVVHGADAAGTYTAHALFAPVAAKLGLADVRFVPVSDTATAAQVRTAMQRAGAANTSVVVALVDVQLCIATYDALRSLNTKAVVVASALCSTAPMGKHLADTGTTGSVPAGWYFGGYGYSPFLPDAASGMRDYLAKIAEYGPPGTDAAGLAGPAFATLLTLVKFANQIGPDHLTATALDAAIKAFRGPMMLVAGPMHCGAQPALVSLCGTEVGVEQYAGGKWVPVADALNDLPIDTARY